MGYKVFQNGFPLPASDLNNFLMNQSVIVFATSGARGTAIASPVEGMITYIEATGKYEFWNGTAWVDLNDNTDAIPKSIMDAQGDLIVASGADTPARLALGGSGALLKSNGTTATWQAVGTVGKVLTSTGTDVSWETVATSGMVEIASVSLSTNQVDFNSIPGIYRDLRLVLKNANFSADNTMRLRVNSTTGIYRASSSGNPTVTHSFTGTDLSLPFGSQDVSDGANFQLNLTISEYATDATFKMSNWYSVINRTADTDWQLDFGVGGIRTASAITSLSLQAGSSGTGTTWAAGTATLYGVK